MEHTRAGKGGEKGINGEWYDGGQFLPGSPNTIKGEMKATGNKRGTGKQEIAPYIWEVAPSPELKSIYQSVAGIFAKTNLETGKLEFCASQQTLNYFSRSREWAEDLIDRYNAGERWMTK